MFAYILIHISAWYKVFMLKLCMLTLNDKKRSSEYWIIYTKVNIPSIPSNGNCHDLLITGSGCLKAD